MSSSLNQERRAFLVLLIFLGICFLYLLTPVFMALLLACILTLLTYPTYSKILKRFRNKTYLSSFLATFLIFLTLVLPFSCVLLLITQQTLGFLSDLQIGEFIATFSSQDFYQQNLLPLVEKIESTLHITFNLEGMLAKLGTQTATLITQYTTQIVGSAAYFIFGFFVMHITIFFLFIEGPHVYEILLDLSPLSKTYEQRLAIEFQNMINATVYGYLVTALVQANLAALGFWIAGVKAPLVFGALTFFMSLVPIVGATSIWLPVALWFFITGEIGWGIFITLYGSLIISGIDNFLKPFLMRGKVKIHILLIFFSLLGGLKVFGPIGILFGPVITALFIACIRIYREDFLKKAAV